MSETKYRLVTRSDFDGVASAALLKSRGLIDEILFVHPKDMQDGKVAITDKDITTNLPYVQGVHLAFDHHLSETLRVGKKANHIIDPKAPSAARVVFDHYGGKQRFPMITDEIMDAVDKADSAQFSEDEILHPRGWVLMNYLMDARTGLGRFREFRIANYELMMQLIDFCRSHTIDEVLELPDVKERVDLYFAHEPKAVEQIKRCSKVYGNLVVLDLRREAQIWATNRFTIYALFPKANISIHVLWGKQQQNVVFAVGKSIVNRTSRTHVGTLMLNYDGGGHEAAGTCQVDTLRAEGVLEQLIEKITTDR